MNKIGLLIGVIALLKWRESANDELTEPRKPLRVVKESLDPNLVIEPIEPIEPIEWELAPE